MSEPIELEKEPEVANGNRFKIRALTIIAVIAEASVLGAGAAAWSQGNTEIVSMIIAAQLGFVGTIVGFLTGSSQPDRSPE